VDTEISLSKAGAGVFSGKKTDKEARKQQAAALHT
jgi:hypothetical protein